MADDGGPAFPQTALKPKADMLASGMSLWSYYAAAALAGAVASNPTTRGAPPDDPAGLLAEAAAVLADALIAEQRKRFGKGP